MLSTPGLRSLEPKIPELIIPVSEEHLGELQ